jgi:hypothetical protein
VVADQAGVLRQDGKRAKEPLQLAFGQAEEVDAYRERGRFDFIEPEGRQIRHQ